MKKQTFIISLAFTFSIQTKAQNTIQAINVPQATIPPRSVVQQQTAAPYNCNVGNITLTLDSSVIVNATTGGTKNYFKAVINSTGTGTIQYQWVLVNVVNMPNNHPSIIQGTLQLSGTGTDVIFTQRDHLLQSGQKKLLLEMLSPNSIESNQIKF